MQPLLITDLYKDSAAKNRTLLKAIEDQFILGTNYNYNYNQLQGKPAMSGGLYFNGNVDLSGNVAGLLSGADAKDGKVKEIFKAPFSQYIRLEADNRYYSKLSKTAVWANRLILGFGLPYGNSLQLPYIKQFFGGGDWRMVSDWIQAVAQHNPNLLTSTIDASIESHIMCFMAEESRLHHKVMDIRM